MSGLQRSSLAASLVTSVLGRQPVVAVPMAFIQLLPDCTAATFLAQCCYLSEHAADPDGWFERSHAEWRADLCLSPEQVRRCVRDCAGMVEVKKMGLPARNFYRVLPEGVKARLATLRSVEDKSQTVKAPQAMSCHRAPAQPVTSQTRPPAVRPTPPHYSSLKKEEQKDKKIVPGQVKDDVRPTPPVATGVLTKLLSTWNANRGELPEAAGLSTPRRKALTVLLADCDGDAEKAAGLLTDATREVAADDFWKTKKFGLDTLLPKVLGKAEAYRSRQAPKATKAPARLPDFGVGQCVLYRRERYAIEAITDRHIDLWDDENGSLRILINSDDIRAIRPLEVRA